MVCAEKLQETKEFMLFYQIVDAIPAVVIVDWFVYNDNNVIIEVGNLGDAIMSDINVLPEKAVNETTELSDGEVFLLRDLFKGYEWNRILKSNRLLLGTLFLKKICSENLEIATSTKTSPRRQKHQIVRRNNHA